MHPAPTEKSQVVVTGTGVQNVFRFNSVRKGEREYKALLAAWDKRMSWTGDGRQPKRLHHVDGDMYVGTVDLGTTLSVCFVDIDKRMSFRPYQE